MKKTWTKALAVALSCMMAFALAACGGGSSAGDGKLHIGVIGPFTGGAALYGNAVKNGAELAVNEINAANADGLQIVMESQDDEHDAEKSVNAYNNVFQLCFSDPNQGIASADYMAENFADAKVGVIYKNDDNYSTGIFNKFKAEWEAKGKKVEAEETFTDGVTDFSAQLNSLKNAGVDLVFLPIYYDAASNILTQADKMGYAPKFFGCDGMDGILSMEGFDTSLAE